MNYCPQKDKLMISTEDAKSAFFLLNYALKKMRLMAELPLDKYESQSLLTNHDHAAIAIIEAANKLGIDFGVTPHNHNLLDLRDV